MQSALSWRYAKVSAITSFIIPNVRSIKHMTINFDDVAHTHAKKYAHKKKKSAP